MGARLGHRGQRRSSQWSNGVVSVGRAGEVRPSSRSAIDGACAEVFCCANIMTPEYTRSPAIAEGPRDAGVPVEIW